MPELLLGCGSSRAKKLVVDGRSAWTDLVTLDMTDAHRPDVVHDIADLPLPFANDAFDDVVHAAIDEASGQFAYVLRAVKPARMVVAHAVNDSRSRDGNRPAPSGSVA